MASTSNTFHSQKIINFIFWLGILLIVSVLFIILNPKISADTQKSRQVEKMSQLIESIESSKTIDPKNYWEFREFYSKGNFRFNKAGIDRSTIDEDLLELLPKDETTPYLLFNSDGLQSIDSLTSYSSLTQILLPMIESGNVIYQDDFTLVFQDKQNTYLIFLKPYSDFENTSGFFEHWGGIEFPTDKLYWLNITQFKN